MDNNFKKKAKDLIYFQTNMMISKKKYSNEFTIIYIIFAPISYYYEKFLNINNLEKNSFKTKICDISEMFF